MLIHAFAGEVLDGIAVPAPCATRRCALMEADSCALASA